ncbi:MAG: NADH-quinone oxidoreductase subunit M [Phycisphaeraceae bacterium]|nr:NADH-quinone oxidoreductase subunit M [Phycisphaeraceae bacterium]
MAALLNWMIFLPLIGGVLCLAVASRQAARQVALWTSIATFVLSVILAAGYYGQGYAGVQFVTQLRWIDSINVEYRTGVDGLSLPLVLLTTALSVLVVIASWDIQKAAKAYLALYLFLMTGMLGVFLALDLFLFYVFFEVSLLPMYFLIGVWGGPRKEYAAIKFFLYTLFGSICLLVVMLGIYFFTPEAAAGGASGGGQNTWDMIRLQTDPAIGALFARGGPHWGFAKLAFWLTLIAFLVKLPGVPFHTWLPDAHVEAPTPISMILAGVLLKMGGYAMMRITWPFFPDAAILFWKCAAGLGVISIVYGAFCAMAQADWKKLVAYSSVSHMGYVLLGLAVLTRAGFDGAYYQMIAHGITSAMMFFLVGVVYDRAHHRQIDRLGGLWLKWPAYSGWAAVGFFAAMGLPGLCGFVGEVMVLLGTFQAVGNPGFPTALVYTYGVLAASGVILTAGYILWMFQRVYMGPQRAEYAGYEPVKGREYFIMVTLGLAALVFGVVPYLVFVMTNPTFDGIMKIISVAVPAAQTALGG